MSVLKEVEQLKKEKQEQSKTILAEVTEQTLNQAANQLSKQDKDIKELAKDLTYLKGASDLQYNEDFKSVYETELGSQLLKDLQDEGKRAAIIAQSKKYEANNLKSQSYYNGMKPLFETLGIDKPFGLVAMIITSILLMIPYLIISLITFTINSINSIFTAISKFTKPAYWICTILIIITITAVLILIILVSVDKFFGTTIIQTIKR